MQEILNNLKTNSLLQISNWWGLRDAGKAGTIITKDKMLYKYSFYHRLSPFLETNNIPKEYISEGIKLSDEEYERVIKFIEEEIVDKTFIFKKIYDVGYNVSGNYNGHHFNINNNIGFSNEEKGLYNKAKELIETIKGEN